MFGAVERDGRVVAETMADWSNPCDWRRLDRRLEFGRDVLSKASVAAESEQESEDEDEDEGKADEEAVAKSIVSFIDEARNKVTSKHLRERLEKSAHVLEPGRTSPFRPQHPPVGLPVPPGTAHPKASARLRANQDGSF